MQNEMSNYIQGLPDYIRKQLAECKEKIYHFIDERFEAFEARLIDEIRSKYEEEGVYSRK
jgi:protein associated with RNAse G/E